MDVFFLFSTPQNPFQIFYDVVFLRTVLGTCARGIQHVHVRYDVRIGKNFAI